MGQDTGMMMPSPQMQNLARGADANFGAAGIPGTGPKDLKTPQMPAGEELGGLPGMAPAPQQPSAMDQLKLLIAQALAKGKK